MIIIIKVVKESVAVFLLSSVPEAEVCDATKAKLMIWW